MGSVQALINNPAAFTLPRFDVTSATDPGSAISLLDTRTCQTLQLASTIEFGAERIFRHLFFGRKRIGALLLARRKRTACTVSPDVFGAG